MPNAAAAVCWYWGCVCSAWLWCWWCLWCWWRCTAEPEGPAAPDFGTPADAWQKNELGYYFNTNGQAMPAAVLKGMDVSKFQGEVDWEKAKAA